MEIYQNIVKTPIKLEMISDIAPLSAWEAHEFLNDLGIFLAKYKHILKASIDLPNVEEE